jgi:hypothetical protein
MNSAEKKDIDNEETNEEHIQLVEADISDVDQVEVVQENKEKLVVTAVLESALHEAIPYIDYTYNATSIYFVWILMHYFSAQLYVYYCAPVGIYGLIISPFLISAPHCRALRWIIHSGGNMVDNMWIILGTWLCSKMLLNK